MKLMTIITILLIITSIIILTFLFVKDYDKKCKLEDFENLEEMEMDAICGDFGLMRFKLIGMAMIYIIILSILFGKERDTDDEENEGNKPSIVKESEEPQHTELNEELTL